MKFLGSKAGERMRSDILFVFRFNQTSELVSLDQRNNERVLADECRLLRLCGTTIESEKWMVLTIISCIVLFV